MCTTNKYGKLSATIFVVRICCIWLTVPDSNKMRKLIVFIIIIDMPICISLVCGPLSASEPLQLCERHHFNSETILIINYSTYYPADCVNDDLRSGAQPSFHLTFISKDRIAFFDKQGMWFSADTQNYTRVRHLSVQRKTFIHFHVHFEIRWIWKFHINFLYAECIQSYSPSDWKSRKT